MPPARSRGALPSRDETRVARHLRRSFTSYLPNLILTSRLSPSHSSPLTLAALLTLT